MNPVRRRHCPVRAMLLFATASLAAPWIASAATAPQAVPPAAVPGNEGVRRFSDALSDLLSRQQGLVSDSEVYAFPLQGHGLVFVTRAIRLPPGGPAAYLLSLGIGGERAAAEADAASASGGRLAPLPEGRPLAAQAELARTARMTELLLQAHQQVGMLREQLNELRRTAKGTTPAAPVAPDGIAPWAGAGNWPEGRLARLELEVAALDARTDELEAVLDGGGGISKRSSPAGMDEVAHLGDEVADLMVREGTVLRTTSPGKVTVVVLVRPIGVEGREQVLQVSAEASDLSPARGAGRALELRGEQPGEQAARRKVIVTLGER